MDETNQLWNVYSDLRGEIKAADSLNYQILGIMVAAVAALLAAGFSDFPHLNGLLITACVYAITFPAYALLRGNRRRIWRISTYLRVFVEPKIKANWETMLDLQGKAAKASADGKRKFSSRANVNEWLVVNLMNWIAGLVISLHILWLDGLSVWQNWGIIAGIVAGNAALTYYFWEKENDIERGGCIEKSLKDSWEGLQ